MGDTSNNTPHLPVRLAEDNSKCLIVDSLGWYFADTESGGQRAQEDEKRHAQYIIEAVNSHATLKEENERLTQSDSIARGTLIDKIEEIRRVQADNESKQKRVEELEKVAEEANELLAYLTIHGGIDEVEGQMIVFRLHEANNALATKQ